MSDRLATGHEVVSAVGEAVQRIAGMSVRARRDAQRAASPACDFRARGVVATRWRSTSVCLMVALLAACGSTLPEDGFVGSAGPRVSEESSEFGGDTQAVSDFSGSGGAAGSSDGSSSNVAASGRSGASAPDSEAVSNVDLPGDAPSMGAPGDRPFGHGVTDDSITIGIGMLEASAGAALNAGFGTTYGEPVGTPREWLAAVVDYMNERGGLGGRQIETSYYEIALADSLTPDGRRRVEQEMCAAFTEDADVFAMAPFITHEGIIVQCGADSDTPVIAPYFTDRHLDRQRASEIGQWYYAPNWMTTDRREKALVERLVAQGWFPPDAKVGIMMEDKPEYRRGVENAMKPALAAAGIDVVAEAAFPDAIQSPWDTYVLQFRQAGVTHVLWSACNCGAGPGLFANSAENQRYRPKHAFGSENDYRNLPDIGNPEQLDGAGGIGWFPSEDLKEQPNEPLNEPASACQKISTERGWLEGSTSIFCEIFFFLAAALDRAPSITSEGLMAGVESLADSYIPVTTHAASFGRGRHDGAAAVWDVAFDRDCDCFVYKSGPHPVG